MECRDEIYFRIRDKLLDGSVRSSRDLSRRRLAETLKVNPSQVQWALMRMEVEGLLESRPQSGTSIRQLSPQEFQDLRDIRELIEPYAAARAARMITPRLLTRLQRAVAANAEIPEAIIQADSDEVPTEIVSRIIRIEMTFHGVILEAARNREAIRIVEHAQIFAHLARYFPAAPRDAILADARTTLAGHRAILEAIRLGKADLASRRMKDHLALGSKSHPLPQRKDAR